MFLLSSLLNQQVPKHLLPRFLSRMPFLSLSLHLENPACHPVLLGELNNLLMDLFLLSAPISCPPCSLEWTWTVTNHITSQHSKPLHCSWKGPQTGLCLGTHVLLWYLLALYLFFQCHFMSFFLRGWPTHDTCTRTHTFHLGYFSNAVDKAGNAICVWQ